VKVSACRSQDRAAILCPFPRQIGNDTASLFDDRNERRYIVRLEARFEANVDPAACQMEKPAISRYVAARQVPSPAMKSRSEIRDFCLQNAHAALHPAGTCRMGTDGMAVVDPQLRVRGVEGLRVADASIMPTLISGNPNAVCIMIGERAADFIKAAR